MAWLSAFNHHCREASSRLCRLPIPIKRQKIAVKNLSTGIACSTVEDTTSGCFNKMGSHLYLGGKEAGFEETIPRR